MVLAVFVLLLGADKRTLIPIKYRNCPIPDILRYIAMLDYTREDTKPWFWQRLASSLRTAAPQSAILHPFAFGPGYPLVRSLSATSHYSIQPYPLISFDARPAEAAAPDTVASPPTSEVHLEMMPVSLQFPEVQSSEPPESSRTSISAARRHSSRHYSWPGKLKSSLKTSRKK